MNKVILIGNLGQDPEVVNFDNGGSIAKTTLATNESYKNRDGEKVSQTTWHNLIFRGNVVDVVEKYLKQGDKIAVEGKISNRSYEDRDGNKRYVTEIIVMTMHMLGSNNNNAKADAGNENVSASPKAPSNFDENDDDLPF